MFTLFKRLFQWFYTPRESGLGGLTGGDSIEDPLEETKYERDEDYDQLYDEQMDLNQSLVFS
jgi:hypothetical protein